MLKFQVNLQNCVIRFPGSVLLYSTADCCGRAYVGVNDINDVHRRARLEIANGNYSCLFCYCFCRCFKFVELGQCYRELIFLTHTHFMNHNTFG